MKRLLHAGTCSHADASGQAGPRGNGYIARTAQRCAVACATMLATPLVSGLANAQESAPAAADSGGHAFAPAAPDMGQARPTIPTSAPAGREYEVRGEMTELSDGVAARSAYIVIRGSPDPARIEVEGPATLNLLFYPVISKERFATPNDRVPRTVSYMLGPVGGPAAAHAAEGESGVSPYGNKDVDQSALVIGTAIPVAIAIPAGKQAVSFPDMMGFFEVVGVKRPEAQKPAEPAPEAERPEAKEEEPERRHGYGKIDDSLRPVLSVEFERLPLHAVGTAGRLEGGHKGNIGSIYTWNGLVSRRITGNHSLVLGALFSNHRRLIDLENLNKTAVQGYFADLAAGVSYQDRGHYLYAVAYGGWRGIATQSAAYADGSRVETFGGGYDVGGMAGYEYSRFARLRVSGGNNPFNPLTVQAYGALPYTWAEGVFPYLQADFLTLHALAPVDGPGNAGRTRLSENAYHMRALAGVPVWRLGPVVPVVFGGAEMNMAGGGITGKTGIAGGGLRMDFIHGLEIEANAGASFDGNVLTSLRLIVAR